MNLHNIISTAKNRFYLAAGALQAARITGAQAAPRLRHIGPVIVIGCVCLTIMLASSATANQKADASQKNTPWQALSGEQAKANGAVSLLRQNDKTWLAQGAKPGNITYTVTGGVPVKTIHGIRLDVLPHSSLPGGGPGRAHHGNFVLSRFSARLIVPNQPPRDIVFSGATADFSQAGYSVHDTLRKEGIHQLGWAIANEMGQAHYAVFVPKEPLVAPAGAQLEIQLHHHLTLTRINRSLANTNGGDLIRTHLHFLGNNIFIVFLARSFFRC